MHSRNRNDHSNTNLNNNKPIMLLFKVEDGEAISEKTKEYAHSLTKTMEVFTEGYPDYTVILVFVVKEKVDDNFCDSIRSQFHETAEWKELVLFVVNDQVKSMIPISYNFPLV